MIYVEQYILDPKSMMPIASMNKSFTSAKEFNEYYKLATTDPCVIINVMNYDPQKNAGQKEAFDVKLFSVSRETVL